jgi:hypothetical protein
MAAGAPATVEAYWKCENICQQAVAIENTDEFT